MADQDSTISRRQFVKTTIGATAAWMIVPRHVLGRGFQAPSDLVNVATVGVTGMGTPNTRAVMSQNVVALCDVDLDLLDRTLAGWSKPRTPQPRRPAPPAPPQPWKDFGPSKAQLAADAKWAANDPDATLQRFVEQQLPRSTKYQDYREMLEKQKDLDAVIIATPDHMHAPIASAAMSLGKHVYVQKPMCWSVHEARHLAKKAKDNPKIVTQMGNQRHSLDVSRRGVEYVWAARSAMCARSTSGPIVRSVSGRRAFRGRRRLRGTQGSCPGTTAASCSGWARRCWAERRLQGARQARRGISSSALRRRSTITRCITRSTGAGGSIGARARSATWARI